MKKQKRHDPPVFRPGPSALALFLAFLPAQARAQASMPDFQFDPVEYWASRLLIWALVLTILLVGWGLVRVFRGQLQGAVTRGLLLISIVPLPLFCLSTGMLLVLTRAERVEFCGSCHHALQPYVDEMMDPQSASLAAVHYRYQYIASNQCYACHTSYGLFGTFKAKAHGVRQVLRYYANAYEVPLKMWQPYSNRDCLKCHYKSEKWLGAEEHLDPATRQAIFDDTRSCMECHAGGHLAAKTPGRRAS